VSKAPKITPDEYFALLEPPAKTVAAEARLCILETAPELSESIKYGVPFYSFKGVVCYLNVPKSGVEIGFPHGVLISDVFDLFRTEPLRQVRHIPIPSAVFIREHREEIRNYIIEAMVMNDGNKM
jgi:hypothetical protein